MTAELTEQIKITDVCVVTEHHRDGSGKPYLFGVFRSEDDARMAYGSESTVYRAQYDTVPLWLSVARTPPPPVVSDSRGAEE